MPNIEGTIQLVLTAHWGQVDRSGQPYIIHLLRVMLRVDTEEEKLVALLHDAIEDTHYEVEDLVELGYSEEVVAAVDLLTRRDNEHYEDYILRVGANPLARKVKLADLDDHLDYFQTKKMHEAHAIRYRRAWHTLTKMDASSSSHAEGVSTS